MIAQRPTSKKDSSHAARAGLFVALGPRALMWSTWILIAAAMLLALVNLPYAPRTWFDEGSHLHVPKTLLQHGVYADISSEGYRYYGPTIGVGPTVMLPITAMFKLFGVGLLQGRLVVTCYLFVALIAFYTLGRRLYGSRVGLLTLLLVLASRTVNYEGMVEYGRQVLGEVPGVAFLVLGVLAWMKAVSDQPSTATTSTRGRWLWPIAAGLSFGLALVTKNQFVLIVPPTLMLVALLDWRYYRASNWLVRLVPVIVACGCYGLWTLAQFTFLGPGSFFENMQQTRQAAGGAIFVFSSGATLRAIKYVIQPYGGLLLPALAYTLWQARRRDAQGLCEALIGLMMALWLVWYVGASLGWPRYAFPAVVFGALTVARMLADGWSWLRHSAGIQRYVMFGLAGYTALAIVLPLTLSLNVVLHPDNSAQQFAAYLNATVPQNTIVETWEPELGVLTDHRYHYPPIKLLDTAVRHEWLDMPAVVYDGLQDQPQYVAVGKFGRYTNVYPAETLNSSYIELQSFGAYTLYKHK